jgi:tetratricopeptide (TPR) repeat protein
VAERARIRLTELNRLFGVTEPTDEDRQRFEALLVEAVRLTENAIVLDRTNPFNYALLASLYGLINPGQFEGVVERRDEALAEARRLDPKNPEYQLLAAQIALRHGDTVRARSELQSSLTLKGNLTDALFLLAQLDVQEGNATSAIATTRSIISLEPSNPGRRYQLGLLLLATESYEEAAQAFSSAVALDQNYANARYMLALTYLNLGRNQEALDHLKVVALTNADNQDLATLITQLETGEVVSSVEPAPVTEADTVEAYDQAVTSNPPDTDLVTPVNRLPQPDEESEEAAAGE